MTTSCQQNNLTTIDNELIISGFQYILFIRIFSAQSQRYSTYISGLPQQSDYLQLYFSPQKNPAFQQPDYCTDAVLYLLQIVRLSCSPIVYATIGLSYSLQTVSHSVSQSVQSVNRSVTLACGNVFQFYTKWWMTFGVHEVLNCGCTVSGCGVVHS